MDAATLYLVVVLDRRVTQHPPQYFETVQECETYVGEIRTHMPTGGSIVQYECRRHTTTLHMVLHWHTPIGDYTNSLRDIIGRDLTYTNVSECKRDRAEFEDIYKEPPGMVTIEQYKCVETR